MRKPAPHPASLALFLLSSLTAVATGAGCRSVTIVSFQVDGDDPAPAIDKLVIDAPDKDGITLYRLSDTLGLVDVAGKKIVIKVRGCAGDQAVLSNRDVEYTLTGDVHVHLAVIVGHEKCPNVIDGGVIYPDSGSGAGGMMTIIGGGSGGAISGSGGAATGIGGASGGASGTGGVIGGTGGSMTGSGGAGGNTDGGVDGNGGECGDIHDGAPMVACELPQGAPEVPTFTVNPDCTTYCDQFFSTLPTSQPLCPAGIYADSAECVRYCSLAAWPTSMGSVAANDKGNDITCRRNFLSLAALMAAAMPNGNRTSPCTTAGPIGGGAAECNGGLGVCGNFCHGWAAICGGDATTCMTACTPAAANCRFPWLQRAASDHRYCALIDLPAPACLVPGC